MAHNMTLAQRLTLVGIWVDYGPYRATPFPVAADLQSDGGQCGEIVQHRLGDDEARPCGNGHPVAPTIARAMIVPPRPAASGNAGSAPKPAPRPLIRRGIRAHKRSRSNPPEPEGDHSRGGGSGAGTLAGGAVPDGTAHRTASRSRLPAPAECRPRRARRQNAHSGAMRLTTSSAVNTGPILRPP
jgi:hypothetical protein